MLIGIKRTRTHLIQSASEKVFLFTLTLNFAKWLNELGLFLCINPARLKKSPFGAPHYLREILGIGQRQRKWFTKTGINTLGLNNVKMQWLGPTR